jgi:hypothetical protein
LRVELALAVVLDLVPIPVVEDVVEERLDEVVGEVDVGREEDAVRRFLRREREA